MSPQDLKCPLCQSLNVHEYCSGTHWPLSGAFYFCQTCSVIFKHPDLALSAHEEKARYDLHTNSTEDLQYLNYLKHSWTRFMDRVQDMDMAAGIKTGAQTQVEDQAQAHSEAEIHTTSMLNILDYGCGPVKALEHILQDAPFNTLSWDKYYHSTPLELESFDIIFCHEVVEHFTQAQSDFEELLARTHPGSLLFIRTELYPDSLDEFKAWYYKNDPTHVIFYHPQSFKYLAQRYNLKLLDVFDGNKILLQTT